MFSWSILFLLWLAPAVLLGLFLLVVVRRDIAKERRATIAALVRNGHAGAAQQAALAEESEGEQPAAEEPVAAVAEVQPEPASPHP